MEQTEIKKYPVMEHGTWNAFQSFLCLRIN